MWSPKIWDYFMYRSLKIIFLSTHLTFINDATSFLSYSNLWFYFHYIWVLELHFSTKNIQNCF